MTHTEAAADLEEAELQRHLDRDREDLADDERGPAELAEWARIVQLLAISAYAQDTDAVVQDELAADAEREERARQLGHEKRRQEEEAEAARRAALTATRRPRSPSTRCSPACMKPEPARARGPCRDRRPMCGRRRVTRVEAARPAGTAAGTADTHREVSSDAEPGPSAIEVGSAAAVCIVKALRLDLVA
ncbi:hypothetical protein [Streptomyces sp. NBC_00268]|uniref:hypothetical protein n=1 Tax=Streptomyces sp. NBC_00268 TaxID=2975695 RepID=UPI0022508999|nr:hypothetical protein [Streptomyces sp. NBC_00268]MCX5192233.1 hypothetical protein [Streptomyces sp. NBC_00268]